MRQAENYEYYRRNRLWVSLLAVAIQLAAVVLFPLTTFLGNFDFLLYILFGVITLLDWVLLFGRTVYLTRNTSVWTEGGVVFLRTGYWKRVCLALRAADVSELSVKEKKGRYDLTLRINERFVKLPCLTAELTEEISRLILGESGAAECAKNKEGV